MKTYSKKGEHTVPNKDMLPGKFTKQQLYNLCFYFQTITERVHVEKRYGPRRPVTSPDENRDIAAQIRGKISNFVHFHINDDIF